MDLIKIIDSIIFRIILPLNDNAWNLVSWGVSETLIHSGTSGAHFKISFYNIFKKNNMPVLHLKVIIYSRNFHFFIIILIKTFD